MSGDELERVRLRLENVTPEIKKMLVTAGTVGLSYGIVHRGEIVLVENFGYRDLEQKIAPDYETVYPICSMTKGLVTSLLGILVEEGKLDFYDFVQDMLPSYKPPTQALRESARLSDWLSMQSGTEPYQVWFQSQNNIIFLKQDVMKVVNNLQPESELRTTFDYSNWGYEIAAQIIQERTGQRLHRTDARVGFEGDNVAKAYTVLDDGTPINIPRTRISGATILGAGGGVHSCIKDLLKLYGEILKASIDQFRTNRTFTEGSIFKRLTTTMSAHSQMLGTSFHESSYGMGWLRTQLPNQMCKISPNLAVLGNAPVLGEGDASQLLIAHYGSMPGAYCGVNLFPETNSLIIVLSNSTPMCDMADWTIQLLTQTLFDYKIKHDYPSWVERTVKAEQNWYPNTLAALVERRTPGTQPRCLTDYVGKYINQAGTFRILVFDQDGKMYMQFQELEEEVYALDHFEYDSFCWLQTRNSLVRRGRWVLQKPDYFLIHFEFDESSSLSAGRFKWVNDPSIPQGEIFSRFKDEQT